MKKIIVILFSVVFSFQISAQEYSGVCGDHLTWQFDLPDSTLYILGYGSLRFNDGGLPSASLVPWDSYRNEIAHVYLQEGISDIYSMPFYNCSNLRDIYIPSTLRSIYQAGAFINSGLENIVLPEGFAQNIGTNISSCQNLKRIVIPSTATNLSYECFGNNYNLQTIECFLADPSDVNIPPAIADGPFHGIDLSQCTLIVPSGTGYLWQNSAPWNFCTIQERGDYLINGICGDNLTWTLDTIFYCLSIEGFGDMYNYTTALETPWYQYKDYIYKIDITPDITHIGDYAFSGLYNLRGIDLFSDTYVSIGVNALQDISSLTVLMLNPNKSTTFLNNEQWGSLTIREKALPSCVLSGFCGDNFCDSLIWSLDTCTGVLDIVGSGRMFYSAGIYISPWKDYTNNILAVNLPDGLTYLPWNAFAECRRLKSVIIPNSCSVLEGHAFGHCDSLVSITLPTSLKAFHPYSFYYCEMLDTIRCLTDSVVELIYDFSYDAQSIPSTCKLIVKYDIIDQWKNDPMWSKYQIIDECSMVDSCGDNLIATIDTCRGILNINGYGSMSSIPWNYDATNPYGIQNVTLPDGLYNIARGAFYGFNTLKSISIPSSVREINEWAFTGDSSLVEISLPDSLEIIENMAFGNCTSLHKINIPSTLKYIADLFRGCNSIDTIDCYLTNPLTVFHYTFTSIPDTCTLIVNPGTKSLWENAEYWNRFNIVERTSISTHIENANILNISNLCPCYDMQGKLVDEDYRGVVIRSNGQKELLK